MLLFEHVRPENPFLGWLADRVSPLTKPLMGPEMNRRTEESVGRSGFKVVAIRRDGIWREIVAYRGQGAAGQPAPVSNRRDSPWRASEQSM